MHAVALSVSLMPVVLGVQESRDKIDPFESGQKRARVVDAKEDHKERRREPLAIFVGQQVKVVALQQAGHAEAL